jgi:hypothetical protein
VWKNGTVFRKELRGISAPNCDGLSLTTYAMGGKVYTAFLICAGILVVLLFVLAIY